MIFALLFAVLLIAGLLMGLFSGGIVIVVIVAIVGAIILIVKAVSSGDKNEVTVNVQNNSDQTPTKNPYIGENNLPKLLPTALAVDNDTHMIVSYQKTGDREIPEEIRNSLERAYISLNGFQFKEAEVHFNRILDIDPHFSPAYIGLVQCILNIRDEQNLANSLVDFTAFSNWQSACRFATEQELEKYLSYARARDERNLKVTQEVRKQFTELKGKKMNNQDKIKAYQQLVSTLNDLGESQEGEALVGEINKEIEETNKRLSDRWTYCFWGILIFIILAIGIYSGIIQNAR